MLKKRYTIIKTPKPFNTIIKNSFLIVITYASAASFNIFERYTPKQKTNPNIIYLDEFLFSNMISKSKNLIEKKITISNIEMITKTTFE